LTEKKASDEPRLEPIKRRAEATTDRVLSLVLGRVSRLIDVNTTPRVVRSSNGFWSSVDCGEGHLAMWEII